MRWSWRRAVPNFGEARPSDTYPNGIKDLNGHSHAGLIRVRPGEITCQGIPINSTGSGEGTPPTSLAQLLSRLLGRTVLDQTGLKGNYDFTLQFTPDQSPAAMFKGAEDGKPGTDNALPPDSSRPSLFTAIQEQLGLRLESQKGPVQILVIDHVERPSEN